MYYIGRTKVSIVRVGFRVVFGIPMVIIGYICGAIVWGFRSGWDHTK